VPIGWEVAVGRKTLRVCDAYTASTATEEAHLLCGEVPLKGEEFFYEKD